MAGLDGLVNAAGILQVLPFDATTLSDWENVIRVNLTGPWIVCQAALKICAQRAEPRSSISQRV